MRKLAALTAAAVLALGLAACGDDDDDDESGSPTTGSEPAAEVETLEAGVLKICTDAPYEPFEFQDDDGEWTGFDMDLLRAVATNLELELDVVVRTFEGIWTAPAAGECDIVASAMTITDERAENALFSDPYFDADQSLLIRSDDAETFTDLESLSGATIGVQTGTTGEEYANENAPDDAEIRTYDDAAAMFLALESEDVDALLQDFPVNLDRANRDDAFAVAGEFETGEQYGFAASLDNTALIDAVNDQLAALRDDGTYDEIFQEYFPGGDA